MENKKNEGGDKKNVDIKKDGEKLKVATPTFSDHQETCGQKALSCRWIIGYLCCGARFSQSAIRQLIGMATVCMTLKRDELVPETPEIVSEFHLNVTPNSSVFFDEEGEDFKWSQELEGTILSAYNFGFIASPILGGYIAGHFGGKRVIAFSLIVGSIATILTPVAARANDALLIFMRAVAGLVMGAVDPAIQSLWAQWAPKYEKTQLTALSYSGLSIAGIATFLVSGYLCTIPLDHGWPFIFYVFGGFTLLLLFPWLYFVYDSPEVHPRINMDEIKHIHHGKTPITKKKIHPPWSKILSSMPFWAIIVAHITYSWVTSWVLAYLPKYMKNVLKFDMEEDGIASSMPFVGRLISGYLCGYISDWIIKKHAFSTGTVRKIFQVVGCFGCAACTIVIGFMGAEHRIWCVVLLVIGLTFQNFTSVAFRINHLDIAPKFAGVLMGVTVTVAMLSALSAPFITAAIIDEDNPEDWKYVFWVVAGLNIVGAVFFVIFAKGEVQPWAEVVEVATIESPQEETNNTGSDTDTKATDDLPEYDSVVSKNGVLNPAFTIQDECDTSTTYAQNTNYEDSCTKL